MRYIKDVLIEKVMLHVIDKSTDEQIHTMNHLVINVEVENFVRKHILRSLNSEDTYKGIFLKNSEMLTHAKKLISDQDAFSEISYKIAELFFESIRNIEVPDCDILMVQFVAEEERSFGILKLDYKSSYIHDLVSVESGLNVRLISQQINLPSTSQALKKCVFFRNDSGDDLDIIILSKSEKEDDRYFLDKFLKAVTISDDVVKTRTFKKSVEKWVNKNLSEQVLQAALVRHHVNDQLINSEFIDINELAAEMFLDQEEIKSSFVDAMKDLRFGKFLVNKKWVSQNMKSKEIKTDTGFVLKGDMDLFKDSSRIGTKENGDGTIDYIIKNVRNYSES